MKIVVLTALLLSLSSGPLLADKETDDRLAEAAKAFNEIMAVPDKGIPTPILNKAECVLIVPGMKKGGFLVGGSFGRGAVACRNKDRAGWSAPAMIELGGGSVGLEIGAASTDVVMLIMDRATVDSLLKSKFTLGSDASVAAGPVGKAETDVSITAKVLSYSRTKGAFAGVALSGTSIGQDEGANKAVYGKELDSKQILFGTITPPPAAKPLEQALTKYSPKGT